MSEIENCLVSVETLGNLLRPTRHQDRRRRRMSPPNNNHGVREHAFLRPTTPEHLVSLGLTLRKLYEHLSQGNAKSVIWMGEDTYIQKRNDSSNGNVPPGFRCVVCLHSVEERGSRQINVFSRETTPITDSYTSMMHVLADLVAREKTVRNIRFSNNSNREPFSVLPIPSAVLDRLVRSNAVNRDGTCLLSVTGWRVSNDQCQVIFKCCNPTMGIQASLALLDDGGTALIEALQSGRNPVRLHLLEPSALSETNFVEFTNALSNSETLKDISFFNPILSDHMKGMLLGAISRNKGLHSFSWTSASLEKHVWPDFLSLLACHPSLQKINVRGTSFWGSVYDNELKVHRSTCIAEALKTNTTLTDISFDRDLDLKIMRESVLPILELNRFRHRIQAMKQIPNDTVRCGLLGKALVHPRVQQSPNILSHLLSVCSDDFAILIKKPTTTSMRRSSRLRSRSLENDQDSRRRSNKRRKPSR